MNERCVIPEILDSLSHEDPEAKRSRRDLRRVNALMGNYRWGSAKIRESGLSDWVELGAGEGRFASYADSVDQLKVTAVDLAPRPGTWPEGWEWKKGDLFDSLSSIADQEEKGVLAVLFLHHFERDSLRRLGGIVGHEFTRLVFAEPARFRFFWLLSHFLLPLVNRVTRHDMLVSIKAGFRKGELSEVLELGEEWQVRESVHWLGGLRFEAWKEAR